MSVQILGGDCRDVLKTMADQSVNTCVTSPPYFGLRDYGVDGQLGLEATPDEFVAALVGVMREVRRVLRDDGTLWLNLGDSYANDTKWGGRTSGKHANAIHGNTGIGRRRTNTGLKSKDLIGIPWRVAFALQADGWYLRQDIIWHKPNPMPESVTDRCTKAHEYMFMLSKSERYYFDQEAIAEESVSDHDSGNSFEGRQGGSDHMPMSGGAGGKEWKRKRAVPPRHSAYESSDQSGLDKVGRGEGRNKRSVWTIATQPFREAHFATFPPKLIEPCILAGCPVGGMVLDPFGGAGTTGLVADRLQRNAVLIELNPDYAEIARKRIVGESTLLSEVS